MDETAADTVPAQATEEKFVSRPVQAAFIRMMQTLKNVYYEEVAVL